MTLDRSKDANNRKGGGKNISTKTRDGVGGGEECFKPIQNERRGPSLVFWDRRRKPGGLSKMMKAGRGAPKNTEDEVKDQNMVKRAQGTVFCGRRGRGRCYWKKKKFGSERLETTMLFHPVAAFRRYTIKKGGS